jgi:hypothetical protein
MDFFGRTSADDALERSPEGARPLTQPIQWKGITGSGKRSGMTRASLDAMLAHPTGIIIARKPEERGEVRGLFSPAQPESA